MRRKTSCAFIPPTEDDSCLLRKQLGGFSAHGSDKPIKMSDNIDKAYLEKILSTAPRKDVVLHVDINETVNGSVMRFDVLTSNSHGSPVYASKSYCIGDAPNINGIFDFFDDFFQKRINFLYSSISVQRLMLALDNVERRFAEYTGHSFAECYHMISSHAIDSLQLHDAMSNPMMDFLSSGYCIEVESEKTYSVKTSFSNSIDVFKDVAYRLANFFKNGDCGNIGNYVCFDVTEGNRSFFMEDTIGMPMLFHYYDCAKKYLENLVLPYVRSGIVGDATVVEIARLGDECRLCDLLGICDTDGMLLQCGDMPNWNADVMIFDKNYTVDGMLSSIIAH